MGTDEAERPEIRRVVTGHDGEGKATIWLDDIASNHRVANPFITSTLLWSTDASPCHFLGDEDMGARQLGLAPPSHGTRFVHLEIKPGMKLEPGTEVPGMHRTDTIDYGIVLAGEVTLYLDDGVKTVMRPGSICVQRGTNHTWINEGTDTVRLINILMDGAPKRAGSVGSTISGSN
jgi:mannose-6-phosphate isomerase-like protein (cupin superfamily)